MKITEDYISLKKKYNQFFQKYSSSERLTYKDEIITLKKEIDLSEGKIINGILNYSIDYDRVNELLSKRGLNTFLKDNVGIGRFLMNRSISTSMGFNQGERSKVLKVFRNLCEKVWEDYIITKEERIELNQFCKENFIDKTQQFIIEQEVSKSYNEEFDLIKIVKYYFLNENLSDDEIHEILKREYKKDVELIRIKLITSQLNIELEDDLDIGEGQSKLIKTLHWNDLYSIYIIVVNSRLSSGFEFEIGYKEGEMNSWKIIISKTLFENSNRTRIVDIITDAICYHLNSKTSDLFQLKYFLELKSNVRYQVEQIY
ncbi:hypothetical protein N9Y47_00715 [Flavobacteriaceae bacterium]|nr:hypothetical protein [Flavobacteriaceae bacterium]